MLTRIIIGILCLALGFVMVWQNRAIVNITGRNAWAERTLGPAGTFTLVKLLGILIMFLSMLYMTGSLQSMFLRFFGFFFSGLK